VEIGWFCRSDEGRELGPFALSEMRRRWAAGELDRDSQVRHSLEPRHRYAGDVPEIWAEDSGESKGCPCLRHPKRPAVRFCVCCWAPICAKCQLGDRNCRRCHHGLYDRRLLAGIVDLVAVPLLILLFESFLLSPTRSSRTMGPYYFEYGFLAAYPLLLGCFLLLKDWWGSPGKWLLGLRVVDLDSREPCSLLASLQRNLLLPLIYVVPFYLWVAGDAIFYGAWTCLVVFLAEKAAAYRNPMMRRPSELWAGTRVLRTTEGVKWRRVETRRKLAQMEAKTGLKIRYPGSQPDLPKTPPNSAEWEPPPPSDQPEPGPGARPGGAEPGAAEAGSTAETSESTEGRVD